MDSIATTSLTFISNDVIMISKVVIAFRYQSIIGGKIMQEIILRKLFLGFIQIHILYHAKKEPFYGSWMIEELQHHGYEVSAGTLYPILHNLEKASLLNVEKKLENGKIRKYYSISEEGIIVLNKAKAQIKELTSEL